MASAQDHLEFWLVPNEPSIQATPGLDAARAFAREWGEKGIRIPQIEESDSIEPQALALMLGQKEILEALSRFRQQWHEFPSIHVRFFQWGEYLEKLRAAQSGPSPDLVQVPSTWCASLASQPGILAGLPRYEYREALSQYEGELLKPCMVNGNTPLFGLPWIVDARFLYVWRDVLPTLGEDPAPNRVRFQQALDGAEHAQVVPFALPMAKDWELLHLFSLLVWGEDGELVRERRVPFFYSYEPSFQAAALRAVNHLRPLVRSGRIALLPVARGDLEQQFLDHRLGAVISGPWLINQLRAKLATHWEEKVAIYLPPFNNSKPATFLGGSLLGVTKGAEKRGKAGPALQLAQYLSLRAAVPYARAVGVIPAARAALGDVRSDSEPRPEAPCQTYFDCLSESGSSRRVALVIQRGVRSGRTYPPVPQWVKLELSTLTSLGHFWHDLAASAGDNAPEAVLAADIAAVSSDWDEALTRVPSWAIWMIGALLALLSITLVGFFWKRQYRGLLEVQVIRHQEGEQKAKKARQELQELFASRLSVEDGENVSLILDRLDARMTELDELHREQRLKVEREMESLKNPAIFASRKVQDLLTITSPPLEIALATKDRPYLLVSGAKVAGQLGELLERIIRQSLLDGRSAAFSFLLAALHTRLHDGAKPAKPKEAFEVTVTRMRRYIGSKAIVTPRNSNVYRFVLPESQYVVRQGDLSSLYIDQVRDPYLSAQRHYALGELEPALRDALRAHSASRDLLRPDLPILILVCKIAQALSSGQLSGEVQTIYEQAIRDLNLFRQKLKDDPRVAEGVRQFVEILSGRVRGGPPLDSEGGTLVADAQRQVQIIGEMYASFFGMYPDLSKFLEDAGLPTQAIAPDLQEIWDEMKAAYGEIAAVLGQPTGVGFLPDEIKTRSEDALAAIQRLGDAAWQDPGFRKAIDSIVKYYQVDGLQGLCLEMSASLKAQVDSGRDDILQFFAHMKALVIPAAVKDLLTSATPPDPTRMLGAADRRLRDDYDTARPRKSNLLVQLAIRGLSSRQVADFLALLGAESTTPPTCGAVIQTLGKLRRTVLGRPSGEPSPKVGA